MAALYDGSRVFTADWTKDTNACQLFAKKEASPKTSTQGEEGSIFWYGRPELYSSSSCGEGNIGTGMEGYMGESGKCVS